MYSYISFFFRLVFSFHCRLCLQIFWLAQAGIQKKEACILSDPVNVTSTSSNEIVTVWGKGKFFQCLRVVYSIIIQRSSECQEKKAGLSAKEIEATAPFQKQEALNPIGIRNFPVAKHSGTHTIYYLCVL